MEKNIKVAQVLAGAAQGGAENFFVRLVQGLDDSGKMIQKAFVRNHQDRMDALRNGGVDVAGFRFGGPLDFVGHYRYRKSLQFYNPDIVMTWMNRASGLTPRGDYKLICRLGHYYNLKYYKHADYWVGIAKGICDHMIRGGFPADRVFHIPNFADETPVQPLERTSFGTPEDCSLLLAVGRLHVNKGFDVLLAAMVDIPDAILWLAGAGPEEQNLKKLCADLHLDDRVRFLGWRNDVSRLMRTADIFICPSRHEGLGSIVMESWVHECPIVATASQGPGEAIDDGVTGLLTQVDQKAPLALAVNELLKSEALRAKLVENGKMTYLKNYSQDVIVRKYEDLYFSIIK